MSTETHIVLTQIAGGWDTAQNLHELSPTLAHIRAQDFGPDHLVVDGDCRPT